MGDSVFVNKRSAIHKGSAGRSQAFPDVNLCPPGPPAGPIPTPLPNVAEAADLEGGASSVLIEGNPMAKRSSFIARSKGNAVARTTGGGVVSHVVEGKAYFASYSMDITVEGEEVPRHLDMMTHNHLGPSPPNAAVGTYLGTMAPDALLPASEARVSAPKNQRKNEPKAVEVFIDAPGGRPAAGIDAFLLTSADGRFKRSVPASQASLKGGLLCVRFADVPPGKTYSLFYVIGDSQVPVFQRVPLSAIAEHTPGAEKPAAKRAKKATPAPEPARDFKHPPDWYEDYPWTRNK